ncbi:MAG: UDP-N-acetylglucosamine 2-epimerase (non-hydrolyzing) [Syntrophobacteraceae bacterium]|jgi:UDP-N-acetylglucosamine 2-epimerase (non-hydrolysing)
MKILSVVGARPNFMKIAPIVSAIKSYNAGSFPFATTRGKGKIDHFLVHTGQHYDRIMSESFFQDLGISKPDASLGVGSGTHAAQTSEILRMFEPILLDERPDVVIVAGDVNSTLGCALVAAKISYDSNGKRPLIAHVEAGLRSFDRTMPEELNRILTDHLSDLLFVTEQSGIENLNREGISEEKIFFVGNTMIDTLLSFRETASKSNVLQSKGLIEHRSGSDVIVPYALLTLHRPSNVDDRDTFLGILEALEKIATRLPIIFPAHPRTQKQISSFQLQNVPSLASCFGTGNLNSDSYGINITEPLGYVDFLCLMANAKVVLTDSGGIQEETTCLGVPCVTIRENTERPITVSEGTNIISGVKPDAIVSATNSQLNRKKGNSVPKFWDGNAAMRILDAILKQFA